MLSSLFLIVYVYFVNPTESIQSPSKRHRELREAIRHSKPPQSRLYRTVFTEESQPSPQHKAFILSDKAASSELSRMTKRNKSEISYNFVAQNAAKRTGSRPIKSRERKALSMKNVNKTIDMDTADVSDKKRLSIRKGPISNMSSLEFQQWLGDPLFDAQLRRTQTMLFID